MISLITTDAVLIRAHVVARVHEVGLAICETAAGNVGSGLASLEIVTSDLCAVKTTNATLTSSYFTNIADEVLIGVTEAISAAAFVFAKIGAGLLTVAAISPGSARKVIIFAIARVTV